MGRDSSGEFIIERPKVSRQYAMILIENGAATVFNTSSVETIYVNDIRIRPRVGIILREGDRIRIGDCSLVVEDGGIHLLADSEAKSSTNPIAAGRKTDSPSENSTKSGEDKEDSKKRSYEEATSQIVDMTFFGIDTLLTEDDE